MLSTCLRCREGYWCPLPSGQVPDEGPLGSTVTLGVSDQRLSAQLHGEAAREQAWAPLGGLQRALWSLCTWSLGSRETWNVQT